MFNNASEVVRDALRRQQEYLMKSMRCPVAFDRVPTQ